MLTNMFYEVPEVAASVPCKPKFLVDQLDLIGGVQFIFIEVCIPFFQLSLLSLILFPLFTNSTTLY